VQVSGQKRFLLASPEDTVYLYRENRGLAKNKTSSRVDLNKWMAGEGEERKKHRGVEEVMWFVAELNPGDVLYTPPGWWHHVLSVCDSVSVLLPFDMHFSEHLLPIQSF